jgi:DNA-binding transcriptional MocR family regulator
MPPASFKYLATTMAALIENGSLTPGTRLPTHRQLAENQGIALATATRVYKELIARGLVVGEQGRGVFVRDRGVPVALGVEQSSSEGMLDLVFNMPGEITDEYFLRAGLRRLANSGDLEAMLRYQPHGGRPHERKIIASALKAQLGPIDPERLLIVSGAQHGLSTVIMGLLSRNDTVATDALTYTGFKAAALLHQLQVRGASGPEVMVDPDRLERLCRDCSIKAVYLIPTVHNPLGLVMSESQRRRIVEVARKYDILIIEDGAYAFLEENPPPSFVQLAPERTVHIGGFSKNLGTGLRVGYVYAPKSYVQQLTLAIRATTWNAPGIVTALVTGWIEEGVLTKSEDNRRVSGRRRQEMCRKILPGTDIISHPNASFAWLPLRNRRRADPMISNLMSKGIVVSGGDAFAVTEAVPQGLRIAFGGTDDFELERALMEISAEFAD